MKIRIFLFVFFLMSGASLARASVQVVPNGGGARSLQPKTLDLKARIEGGFAATTATWTFSNSATASFEAEFIAEAAPDAVVTGFAYWFKGEKVVARIVEKARAAEIYRGVVQRKRDPALVTMLARNFFRVRISPVEAKTDLRVEVTWVQPLVFQKGELVYEVPLRRNGETFSLQKWDVAVAVAAPNLDVITTNFDGTALGATAFGVTSKNAAPRMMSATGDKTPPETLQVRLKPEAGKTWPLLIANSASSADGASYLAILQNRKSTSERSSSVSQTALKAGDGFLSVGRGKPIAREARTGILSKEIAGVAEKLWAARRIDDLERDVKRRDEVMRLSVRFGLPSRWTSWLAIPTVERARLKEIIEREKREQARQNLNVLGRQMALEVAAGGENTRAYALMKTQFDANSRVLEVSSESELQNYFSRQLADIAVALNYRSGGGWNQNPKENLEKARSLYSQVMRLARRVPQKNRSSWIENAETGAAASLAGAQAVVQSEQLAQAIAQGKNTNALRRQVEEKLGADLGREARLAALSTATDHLAAAWAKSKAAPRLDARRTAALQNQTQRLIARYNAVRPQEKLSEKAIFAKAESSRFEGQIYSLNSALASEIVAHRENDARAQQLRAQIRDVRQRLQYPLEAQLDFGSDIHKIVGGIRSESITLQPDEKKIAALKTELERLKGYSDPQRFAYSVQSGEDEWRRNAPQGLAKRWVEARYGKQSDPKTAEFYATQLQNVLDENYETDKKWNPSFPYQHQNAQSLLQQVESQWLGGISNGLVYQIVAEQGVPRPDEAKIATLHAQLDELQKRTLYNQSQNDLWIAGRRWMVFNTVLENLRLEWKKPVPDRALIADLEKRVVALQPFDEYYGSWGWSGGRRPTDREAFGKLRVERIAVRAQREKLAAKIKTAPADVSLRQQETRLASRENDLTVRMGDPLIAVVAPIDCRQVIAIFPSGEIKKLLYNAQSRRFEARFDVPTYTRQGDYNVTIIIVLPNGARRRLQMTFRVDLIAPRGTGHVAVAGAHWILRLQTDDGTDRVEALLPWGARADLQRGADGVFQNQVEIPEDWRQQEREVVFVLTDRAHNRTEVVVDAAP